MKISELTKTWDVTLEKLLGSKLDKKVINVLAKQTLDSIRRIDVYEAYKKKADGAEKLKLNYFHTSNPFSLAQRLSLDINNKTWIIYLATYFGKSNKSKWNMFMRSAFDVNKDLIKIETILEDRFSYFDYLRGINFFDGMNYSNHRKFTKKSLDGKGGVFESMNYFLDNIAEPIR